MKGETVNAAWSGPRKPATLEQDQAAEVLALLRALPEQFEALRAEVRALAASGAVSRGGGPRRVAPLIEVRCDFLRRVSDLLGSTPWTAAELIEEAFTGATREHLMLQRALDDMGVDKDPRRLGNKLRGRHGLREDDAYELRQLEQRSSRQWEWCVLRVSDSARHGDTLRQGEDGEAQ